MEDFKKMSFGDEPKPRKITSSYSKDKNGSNAPPMEFYLDLFYQLTKDLKKETVLRGNILLSNILPREARLTKDLDMDVINQEVLDSIILPRLSAFGDACIRTNSCDDYRVYTMEAGHSGGIKVYRDGKVVYGVDVSVPEESLFGCEVTNYEFNGMSVAGSTVERIAGDKLAVFLSDRRNRRPKDFYDLFIILRSFPKIDASRILGYMDVVYGRGRVLELLDNYPLSEENLVLFVHSWGKFKISDINGDPKEHPAIEEIMPIVGSLVKKVMDLC